MYTGPPAYSSRPHGYAGYGPLGSNSRGGRASGGPPNIATSGSGTANADGTSAERANTDVAIMKRSITQLNRRLTNVENKVKELETAAAKLEDKPDEQIKKPDEQGASEDAPKKEVSKERQLSSGHKGTESEANEGPPQKEASKEREASRGRKGAKSKETEQSSQKTADNEREPSHGLKGPESKEIEQSSKHTADNQREPSRGRKTAVTKAKPGVDLSMPSVVLEMPAFSQPCELDQTITPFSEMSGFTKATLVKLLDLHEWSFDTYQVNEQPTSPKGASLTDSKTRTKYGVQGCYILDCRAQPYCPRKVCQHGATLVPFIRDQDEEVDGETQISMSDSFYDSLPVFVTRAPGPDYEPDFPRSNTEPLYWYVGHYSQPRYSDKLDCERIQSKVPKPVQQHWANIISNAKSHVRPPWVVHSIKKAILPIPEFNGPVLEARRDSDHDADEATLLEFAKERQAWAQEAAEMLKELTADRVMELFKEADLASTPGLRFYWEYLQAESFERNFYYVLRSAADEMGVV